MSGRPASDVDYHGDQSRFHFDGELGYSGGGELGYRNGGEECDWRELGGIFWAWTNRIAHVRCPRKGKTKYRPEMRRFRYTHREAQSICTSPLRTDFRPYGHIRNATRVGDGLN
jgi:hypothetical protein